MATSVVPAGSKRWFRRRSTLVAAVPAALLVVAGGGLFAGGWYYSNVLRDDALTPDRAAKRLDLEVVTVDATSIRLRAPGRTVDDAQLTRPGTWGLEWAGGYGQLGAVRWTDADSVVREFRAYGGLPAAGTRARFDSFAYPADPRAAFGIAFEDVRYRSSAGGEFDAWLVPGDGAAAWAVFVHGKDADPREGLRILPALHDSGLTTLLITYRDDDGQVASPDGRHHFGATEWQDLEGAVRFAQERGATRVVLVGYSMGGGIALSFMRNSPMARLVAGVILDAPMADLRAAVNFQADARGAPSIVTAVGRRIAAWRFDIDWDALDYLDDADSLRVPILLFHGTADKDVPVATSDRLAAILPGLVTYVRVDDAGHVRAWNLDPEGYGAAVAAFLDRVAVSP